MKLEKPTEANSVSNQYFSEPVIPKIVKTGDSLMLYVDSDYQRIRIDHGVEVDGSIQYPTKEVYEFNNMTHSKKLIFNNTYTCTSNDKQYHKFQYYYMENGIFFTLFIDFLTHQPKWSILQYPQSDEPIYFEHEIITERQFKWSEFYLFGCPIIKSQFE
eukprot:403341874